jgi:hypothetical protein
VTKGDLRGGVGQWVSSRLRGQSAKGPISKAISDMFPCPCLASYLPGSRETGVHLDNHVLVAFRVECVLDLHILNGSAPKLQVEGASLRETYVAFSYNSNMSDDFDGSTPQHVVLLVRQSLRRRDDNGVTSVCS